MALVTADTATQLSDIVHRDFAYGQANCDVRAVVGKMTDFNLITAAILDEDHQEVFGVVTADDVMELLLPTGRRRDSVMARTEQ